MGGFVRAGTTLILSCELLAVRWTPFVHWVEVTVKWTAWVLRNPLTVRRTVLVEWVNVAVGSTTFVLFPIQLTVRRAAFVEWVIIAGTVNKFGLSTATVNAVTRTHRPLVITVQLWPKDL